MKQFIIKTIRFYQRTSLFHLPVFQAFFLSDRVCRFTPTCSEYAILAIEKYGIIRGSVLGIKRIFKCHPLSTGGMDPV